VLYPDFGTNDVYMPKYVSESASCRAIVARYTHWLKILGEVLLLDWFAPRETARLACQHTVVRLSGGTHSYLSKSQNISICTSHEPTMRVSIRIVAGTVWYGFVQTFDVGVSVCKLATTISR